VLGTILSLKHELRVMTAHRLTRPSILPKVEMHVSISRPAASPLDYVPQVRAVDPGISQIRFVVDLPEECMLSSIEAKGLFEDAFGRS
jgi:hypothetical protein